MRTGTLVAIIVAVVIVVAAGVWLGLGYALARSNGPSVTEERQIGMFSGVEVDGEATLLITVGDTTSLRVEAQQSVLERLRTSVEEDTLHLRERDAWLNVGGLWGQERITYHLTVPSLKAMDLSGAIAVHGTGALETDELVISCSGSTDLDLQVQAGTLRLKTSGSADVRLTGSADSVFYDNSGSTHAAAAGLTSQTVSVECSGSSDIEVNAVESLRVRASGSSKVSYLGDPVLDTDISGSGEVRRLEQ